MDTAAETVAPSFDTTKSVIAYLIAFFLIAFFLIGMGPSIDYFENKEIQPKNYIELADLAKESCSGQDYLKTRMNQGPIMRNDLADITNTLTQKANDKKLQDTKAEILGTKSTCA